jgi:hypothetical protein
MAESDTMETNGTDNPPKTSKPPPIFIYGVKNFKEMIKRLSDATGQKQTTPKLSQIKLSKLAHLQ